MYGSYLNTSSNFEWTIQVNDKLLQCASEKEVIINGACVSKDFDILIAYDQLQIKCHPTCQCHTSNGDPSLCAYNIDGRILNPHAEVVITTTADSDETVVYEWMLSPTLADATTDQNKLTIPKDKLTQGSNYFVKVMKGLKDNKDTISKSVELYVAKDPTGGEINVYPETGIEHETNFFFSVRKVTDPENTKLYYHFYYQINGETEKRTMQAKSQDNSLRTTITQHGKEANDFKLTMYVDIYNIHGGMMNKKIEFKVKAVQTEDISGFNAQVIQKCRNKPTKERVQVHSHSIYYSLMILEIVVIRPYQI